MTEKRISKLKNIIKSYSKNHTITDSVIEDVKTVLRCVESSEFKVDSIEEEVNNIIDFLINKELDVYSKKIIRETLNIVNQKANTSSVDEVSDFQRKIKLSLLIIKQDKTIEESIKELKFLTRQVEKFKEATPKIYELSKEYFENI